MKKKLCIVACVLGLSGVEAAEKKPEVVIVEPRYEVAPGTRDPFTKYVAPVVEQETATNAPVEQAKPEDTQEKLRSFVKVVGAMKGSGNQVFGIFNFGVLGVGKSKSIKMGEDSVEVTLLSLDVVTMNAKLKIGKDTINVRKDGGQK